LKRRPAILAVCSLLALVTLVCYWPVTAHNFVHFDDPIYICNNPPVKAGLTWSGVLWAFQSGYASNWHPLTWISHMGDCQLYGLNPAGHHLTNLLFHIANTLLLFLLLQRMTGTMWRSACVAALFAWHPLHVESVAWASERKDVLSTCFFLLTLWAYARYAEGQSLKSKAQSQGAEDGGQRTEGRGAKSEIRNPKSEGSGQSSVVSSQWSLFHLSSSIFYLLALLFFALGLMSKPMLVTLPFVLLLLDFWPLQRLRLPTLRSSTSEAQGPGFEISAPALGDQPPALWPLIREKVPFFALALVASLVTYLVQRTGGAMTSLEVLPWQSRIAHALMTYVRYLSLTVWPARLAVLYPYSQHLLPASVVVAALFLLGLSGLFFLRVRRQPSLTVGWLWYLGTLVPTIGLVQVGAQSMADRYTYIPSIGLFVLVVWGAGALLSALPHRGFLLPAAGTLALGGCLACTWCQLQYWQDSERLYRHAIAVTKDNYIAYHLLGGFLEAAGKSDEAFACYAEAVRLKPNYAEGQYDLGSTLMKRGKLEEAVQHLAAAVKHDPAFAHAHINLGKALLEQGKLDEAVAHLSQAVGLVPRDPEAQYNLGTMLLMQGKPEAAMTCFSEALRLKPEYGEAHSNLGVVLMRQGKLGEGAAHLSAALRFDPNNPEAHYNLGLALLELKHPREAADQFTEALRLNPEAPGPHYHLAIALIRQEETNAALAHAEKARDLALAAGQTALAAKAKELLKQLP
jgi:protein O-mannosyl-transferase